MTRHLKVFSLGLALLALLAVGSVSSRGVFAQDSTATPSATTDDGTTTEDNSDKDSDKSDHDGSPSNRSGRDGHGMNKGGFRAGGFHVDSEALATFLGITTDELRTELRAGGSLAEVAEAHGKTRDELKTFLIEQYTAGLDAIIDGTAGSGSEDKDDSTTVPAIDATPAASTGLLA